VCVGRQGEAGEAGVRCVRCVGTGEVGGVRCSVQVAGRRRRGERREVAGAGACGVCRRGGSVGGMKGSRCAKRVVCGRCEVP